MLSESQFGVIERVPIQFSRSRPSDPQIQPGFLAIDTEITAIPELLRLVDIQGAIITIDAMGTQKAIAAQIIEGKADYVLALKGNQETLHQAVIGYIDEQLEGDLDDAQEQVTTEKGHGREEMRTYLQLPAPEKLPGFMRWKGLKSVGVVTSRCLRDGKESIEVRYYISSLTVDVKRFARAVRGHWGIEIPQSDGPRSDNLCVAGRAGYHRRGGPARAGLMG